MDRRGLEELRAGIAEIAQRISAPKETLPGYGRSRDLAHPHIEVASRGCHFVVVERGEELERNTFTELDDLLYAVFRHVTWSMASDLELRNRILGKDHRRLIFQHQISLLSEFDESWGCAGGRKLSGRCRTIRLWTKPNRAGDIEFSTQPCRQNADPFAPDIAT